MSSRGLTWDLSGVASSEKPSRLQTPEGQGRHEREEVEAERGHSWVRQRARGWHAAGTLLAPAGTSLADDGPDGKHSDRARGCLGVTGAGGGAVPSS